jgi:hypothetical protein
MRSFRVRIRPLGDFCRVQVDGAENCQWLLKRLSESFVFRTCEPLEHVAGTDVCTFQVPYNPPLSRRGFQKLLTALPQVQLMHEPA